MSDLSSHQQPSQLVRAIGIAIVVVVVQALIIPLFAAPAANLAPRDLPIVIAGQPQVTAGLTTALERAQPGAFKISQVPDAAAADQVLRDREAYAAVVVEPRARRCILRPAPVRRWLHSWSRHRRTSVAAARSRWLRSCLLIPTTRAVPGLQRDSFRWPSLG